MSEAGQSTRSRTRVEKRGVKSVACQRCHSRKQRCSGSGRKPCSNCSDAGKSGECVYPSRDRQVKISSQYVEEILKENERLREKTAERLESSGTPEAHGQDPAAPNVQENVQNPLIEDRAWFFPMASLDMPIHISEAADAAFATRFRESLGAGYLAHIPRTSFIPDEPILLLSESGCTWPAPAKARFLAKVALDTVCRYYHMLRRSTVLEDLEAAIRNDGQGERLIICKLYALFALGEVYSTKTPARPESFPGMVYFARARRMVTVPAERPHMDTVEIVLLLVVYSFALNRRHSAYAFASSAVRIATIMGMHLNIPEHQYPDRDAREHRTRLWWSAYVLDRTCVAKLGHPTSIHDDDIQIDLPSNVGFSEASKEDFGDTDYILKNVELARLSTQVIDSIYSRRKHRTPFSQRVQLCLKDLTKWVESLPSHLQLGTKEGYHTAPHIIYLHLTFNQVIILTTRPVLLHVLRSRRAAATELSGNLDTALPESAVALSETCIQCSRHSYQLLTEAWTLGWFHIYDYFNTQYLFSATCILAVSSLLGSAQSITDRDCFDIALDLMGQLVQNGNFAASEYSKHLIAMKESMTKVNSGPSRAAPASTLPFQTTHNPPPYPGPGMTAGMALVEPSLQELLAEPDLNLQLYDTPVLDGMQTPYFPELWGGNWTAS